MMDLVQALTWVNDNIGRFGGDAGNVTIFGQSGGGYKVSMMLAMPSAKGLFHKAIIMSGPGVRMIEPDQAQESTNQLMTALGLGRAAVDKLQALPMQDLIKATGMPLAGPGKGINFSPVVDGVVLPSQPFDPVASGVSATVPIIIGHIRDADSDLGRRRDRSRIRCGHRDACRAQGEARARTAIHVSRDLRRARAQRCIARESRRGFGVGIR
jgi:para-nitrobenzyl esterase